MTTFEQLTKKQLKIVTAYSLCGIGWFSAVSDLITLGVPKKDAEDIINKTGIVGLMI